MDDYSENDFRKFYGSDNSSRDRLSYLPDEEEAERYISSGGKYKNKTRKHRRGGSQKPMYTRGGSQKPIYTRGGKRRGKHSRKTRSHRR